MRPEQIYRYDEELSSTVSCMIPLKNDDQLNRQKKDFLSRVKSFLPSEQRNSPYVVFTMGKWEIVWNVPVDSWQQVIFTDRSNMDNTVSYETTFTPGFVDLRICQIGLKDLSKINNINDPWIFWQTNVVDELPYELH